MAFDPSNPLVIYAAAESGGVWRSENGGLGWVPLTDDLPALLTTDIAVAPSNPSRIYVASKSLGLIISTDRGATWRIADLPPFSTFASATRVAVHPEDADHLLVVGIAGMYRSRDGGLSFEKIADTPSTSLEFVQAIVRHPTDPSTLYVACSTGPLVRKSVDGGSTWIAMDTGLSNPTNESRRRIAIAISQSSPSILYLSTIDSASDDSVPSRVYRTDDAGENWNELISLSAHSEFRISHFLSAGGNNQSWRNNAIAIDPLDEDRVIIGGVGYVRTRDGGQSWEVPEFIGGIHADVVAMYNHDGRMYLAGDGGIWRTSDLGTNTEEINAGLVVRQFYDISAELDYRGRLLAGSQDNGTVTRSPIEGTSWTRTFCCDGFDSSFEPTDPTVAYVTIQYGEIYRIDEFGSVAARTTKVTPPYEATPSFYTRLVHDPVSEGVLYTWNQPRELWRARNGGASWSRLPIELGLACDFSIQDSLAVSPTNPDVLYMLAYCRDTGDHWLLRSRDAGESWDSRRAEQNFSILVADPAVTDRLYAQTHRDGQYSLVVSNNSGESWEDLGALPNSSRVGTIVIDPIAPSTFYCASTLGEISRSLDGGATWHSFDEGIPAATVTSLSFVNDGELLVASTYGRAAWERRLRAPEITGLRVKNRKLFVTGRFLTDGASVAINGDPRPTRRAKTNPRWELQAKAASRIRSGDIVTVVAPDGTTSQGYSYSPQVLRPASQ